MGSIIALKKNIYFGLPIESWRLPIHPPPTLASLWAKQFLGYLWVSTVPYVLLKAGVQERVREQWDPLENVHLRALPEGS